MTAVFRNVFIVGCRTFELQYCEASRAAVDLTEYDYSSKTFVTQRRDGACVGRVPGVWGRNVLSSPFDFSRARTRKLRE